MLAPWSHWRVYVGAGVVFRAARPTFVDHAHNIAAGVMFSCIILGRGRPLTP